MRRRGRLPILAEIEGPAAGESSIWSLRRQDYEQLRKLRDRLGGRRAVHITGDDGAAGSLAIALAGTASAQGLRAVLLECDLGRPRVAADLGLAQSPGLHEYLRWEATAQQILQPLALGGSASAPARAPLVCISAGRQAPDPRTLLGLASFGHMAAKLRHAYDLVVLAGPGLDSDPATTDAVAAQAEVVIAAVTPARRSGRGRRALGSAVRRLPAPPLGAVLVGEPAQRS
jgi:polysaccharide biosynthesis transport protein